MIQYNHLICTASASYIWENIYQYDREFRVHMAKFPERSWGQILQQAWTLFLKDRVKFGGDTHCFGGSSKFKKEIYKKFNKGKCTAGMSCRYDHKCLECGKFGMEPISVEGSLLMDRIRGMLLDKVHHQTILQLPPWPNK